MIPGLPQHATTGAVAIISAMITPAILIMATGNLIASTLTLHSRVIDRARALLGRKAECEAKGDRDQAAFIMHVMSVLRRRLVIVQFALASYYFATGLFVASTLAIAVEESWNAPQFLASTLVVVGALALLAGSVLTLTDTFMSTGLTHRELDRELI